LGFGIGRLHVSLTSGAKAGLLKLLFSESSF